MHQKGLGLRRRPVVALILFAVSLDFAHKTLEVLFRLELAQAAVAPGRQDVLDLVPRVRRRRLQDALDLLPGVIGGLILGEDALDEARPDLLTE